MRHQKRSHTPVGRHAAIALAGAGLAVSLACAGCSSGSSAAPLPQATTINAPAAGPSRNPPREDLRSDAAPVLKRLPALGTPIAVFWQSGTITDGGQPAGTWLDVVATIDARAQAKLRALGPFDAAAKPKGLAVGVEVASPGDEWLTSESLDRAISAGSALTVTAYLHKSMGFVIVRAVSGR